MGTEDVHVPPMLGVQAPGELPNSFHRDCVGEIPLEGTANAPSGDAGSPRMCRRGNNARYRRTHGQLGRPLQMTKTGA